MDSDHKGPQSRSSLRSSGEPFRFRPGGGTGDAGTDKAANRLPASPPILHRSHCQKCAVRTSALCGSISEEASGKMAHIVHRVRLPAGRLIYGGNLRAKSYAIILSGVVKLVNARPDGRQQIVGLQFASDFLGRPYASNTTFFAEAATPLELCTFSGKSFEELLGGHPELERALLKRTLDDLDAARDWMFVLGRNSAQERVASLLYVIALRMQQTGTGKEPAGDEAAFTLPLSRTEMADCLGLRLETVSRQFALLRARGIITTSNRRTFKVLRLGELQRYADGASE